MRDDRPHLHGAGREVRDCGRERAAPRPGEGQLVHHRGPRSERRGAMRGRFHHHRAARPRERHRLLQPLGTACDVDDDIEVSFCVLDMGCRETQRARYVQLALVSSDHRHEVRNRAQHLRDDEAHPPVTKHSHPCVRCERCLLENAACGRDRLDEHRRLVVDVVWNAMKVRARQRQVLGECAGAAAYPDDRSLRAMFFDAGAALRTRAAAHIDLADDTPADPLAVSWIGNAIDQPDELVPGNPTEVRIAIDEVQIGAADACQQHAHLTFTGLRRKGHSAQGEAVRGIEDERAHHGRLVTIFLRNPSTSCDASDINHMMFKFVHMVSRRHFLKSSVLMSAAATVGAQPKSRVPLRVAVVGAGAFGGWTALHLRRAGADVTLIDAWGPGNARASSGGETRVIRTIYGPTRKYVEMAARALALWKEWDQAGRERFYRPTGVLWMIGGDDSYARQSLPFLRDLKLAYDEMDPAAAAKKWPQISFDGIRKAFFEHEGGYLLARHACDAVAGELVRIGGTYLQTAVTSIRSDRQRPDIKLANGDNLRADRYVFACGPWLGRLFPEVIGARVQPTRQEVFYFGTPAGDQRFVEPSLPVWVEAADRFIYGIPGNLHRGFKVADDGRGPEFDPTDGDRTPSQDGERALRAFVSRRFPALANAPVLGAEVCQYENSPDGHFIIDRHPAMPEVWIAGGGSGHGYKMGPALGEMLARQVREDALPDPFFALSRFR